MPSSTHPPPQHSVIYFLIMPLHPFHLSISIPVPPFLTPIYHSKTTLVFLSNFSLLLLSFNLLFTPFSPPLHPMFTPSSSPLYASFHPLFMPLFIPFSPPFSSPFHPPFHPLFIPSLPPSSSPLHPFFTRSSPLLYLFCTLFSNFSLISILFSLIRHSRSKHPLHRQFALA